MKYPHFIKDRLKGQTVYIVASGPSLKDFNYSFFDGKPTIAVNHAYKKVKNPLWCVSVDRGFVNDEDKDAPNKVQMLTQKNVNYPQIIDFEFSDSFTMNPFDGVYHRKSSGAAAITTALHAGAEKIFLYGFDCCFLGDLSHATAGETGFYHRHTDENFKKKFADKVKYFEPFPRDKIINMSPISIIPFFERPAQVIL